MKTRKVIICFVFICAFVISGFIFKSRQVLPENTQSAPQGMVLLQSDSLLPFYISVIEEPNINWQIYVKWLKEVFVSYEEAYKSALPKDTMTGLWQYYNDPLLDNYFEHPSYQWYPVTGVSWIQVQGYMEWKTDRLNEIILLKTRTYQLKMGSVQDDNNFNTAAYLCNLYDPYPRKKGKGRIRDYKTERGTRDVEAGDGIFFPQYRLPTEAEWDLANAWVQDQDHYRIISNALDKENPLDYWQEYYHLATENLNKGSRKKGLDFSNFQAGVSEWLLDNETYRWQAQDNNYEILLKNGWGNFDASALDHYGQLKEKDSIGRVNFVFVQVTDIGQPLYMLRPVLTHYRADEVYYPNPYYKKDSLQMDSLLKLKYPMWNWSFSYNSNRVAPYDIKNFKSFLDYIQVQPGRLTKDSLNRGIVYTELESPRRKVKSGNFRNRNNGIEWKGQKSASPMLGFRCVLPYTGIPVIKGKKVKW